MLLLLASELVESVSKEREDSDMGCLYLNFTHTDNGLVAILYLNVSVAWSDSLIDEN